jgi:hypothetical protein
MTPTGSNPVFFRDEVRMARLSGRTAFIFVIFLLVAGCLFAPISAPVSAYGLSGELSGAEVQGNSPSGQALLTTDPLALQELGDEGQQTQRQSISGTLTPLTDASAGGSWALVNVILCLVGLLEALFFIGNFFYHNKKATPCLFASDFILRMLALCMVLISLTVTCIVSDFSKPAILFDQMSLVILVLFVIQQVALLNTRRSREELVMSKDEKKHFRALRRYDSHGSDVTRR